MASRSTRWASVLVAGLLATGALAAPTSSVAAAARAAAHGAADDTLNILVLGDSYSAGNGATDDQGAEQTYGPDGCRRSRVNWSEKYAAALRATGQSVSVVNHACSGGVAADFTSPRVMDTATNVVRTPTGVTTTAQAEASLRQSDPCNTYRFPDEEFWTYAVTAVNPLIVIYACTRNLRPQADFVNADVDLLLFTMGGNDAGFSAIVTNCFVPGARTSSGCQTRVEAARALLPEIRRRLLVGLAAIRSHGLRDDAKIVQLGYPWLQQDNNFTLSDPPGYDAGNQVRTLVSQGDAAIADAVPTANLGHPGQVRFLAGVPEKFSGHEPDATTPIGNPARWINQVGDGTSTDLFYHPNRFGQTAYAELLTAQGTFGAPTSATGAGAGAGKAKLRLRFTPRRADPGQRVRLRVKVTLADGSRPRGRVVVKGLPGHRKLATQRVRKADRGTVRLTFRARNPKTTRVRVVYRDRVAPVARATHRLRPAP